MTILEHKKQLRTLMRKRRLALKPEEKKRIDGAIASTILSSDLFQKARTVFTYCSMDDEIDTWMIIDSCLQSQKTLCVPRCERTYGVMTARHVTDNSQLVTGKFGIFEPSAEAPLILPAEIDLCIAPCLAADFSGYRLGYGGGYYDRFLSQLNCPIVALCAEDRVIAEVPHEIFDIPCDMIYTERRILLRETY